MTTRFAPTSEISSRSHARSAGVERSRPFASISANSACVAPVGRRRWSTNIAGPISPSTYMAVPFTHGIPAAVRPCATPAQSACASHDFPLPDSPEMIVNVPSATSP